MKDFKQEFVKMKNRILSKENFSFLRYGDGEHALITNTSVLKDTQAYLVDNWHYEGTSPTRLGKKLYESLFIDSSKVFYGIPTYTQKPETYAYFIERLKVPYKNITYADLFINSNFNNFVDFIKNELNESIVLIANKSCDVSTLKTFTLKEFFPVPDNCVDFYETNAEKFEQSLEHLAKYTNTLFFISAGPLSEIIIAYLFKLNSNNRYIDVGSSIDFFTKGKVTRPYMIKGNYYNLHTPVWT